MIIVRERKTYAVSYFSAFKCQKSRKRFSNLLQKQLFAFLLDILKSEILIARIDCSIHFQSILSHQTKQQTEPICHFRECVTISLKPSRPQDWITYVPSIDRAPTTTLEYDKCLCKSCMNKRIHLSPSSEDKN